MLTSTLNARTRFGLRLDRGLYDLPLPTQTGGKFVYEIGSRSGQKAQSKTPRMLNNCELNRCLHPYYEYMLTTYVFMLTTYVFMLTNYVCMLTMCKVI